MVVTLLELPPELLREILRYGLLAWNRHGKRIRIDCKTFLEEFQDLLAVTQTCRTLWHEGNAVFYGEKFFTFHTFTELTRQPRGLHYRFEHYNCVPGVGTVRKGTFMDKHHNLPATLGIQLPTKSIRPFIRDLQLELIVPGSGCTFDCAWDKAQHRYGGEGYKRKELQDWLFPLRDLKELGFEELESLEIVIKWSLNVTSALSNDSEDEEEDDGDDAFDGDMDDMADPEDELQRWTEDKLKKMRTRFPVTDYDVEVEEI
jgi:hypothetical protein